MRLKASGYRFVTAAFAASLFTLAACQKQEVGFVDASRFVQEVERFQSARDSVKRYGEEWRRDAHNLDSAIKEIGVQITGETKAGRRLDSLTALHGMKQHDLQRFVQASMEKERKIEGELMAPQLKSTNECLQRFILTAKLKVLLGTQQPGTILAGDPKADFTEKAVRYINTECKE